MCLVLNSMMGNVYGVIVLVISDMLLVFYSR